MAPTGPPIELAIGGTGNDLSSSKQVAFLWPVVSVVQLLFVPKGVCKRTDLAVRLDGEAHLRDIAWTHCHLTIGLLLVSDGQADEREGGAFLMDGCNKRGCWWTKMTMIMGSKLGRAHEPCFSPALCLDSACARNAALTQGVRRSTHEHIYKIGSTN